MAHTLRFTSENYSFFGQGVDSKHTPPLVRVYFSVSFVIESRFVLNKLFKLSKN